MTRKEGIIAAATWDQKSFPKSINDLLQSEYNNYTELCDFCSEQPKPIDIWLNETITPKTNK